MHTRTHHTADLPIPRHKKSLQNEGDLANKPLALVQCLIFHIALTVDTAEDLGHAVQVAIGVASCRDICPLLLPSNHVCLHC